jgi:hypothetical protein
MPLSEDRMFSQQFTRQLSTSPPPPFSYSTSMPSESFSYPSYSTTLPYSTVPTTSDVSLYTYSAPFSSPYPSALSSVEYPTKHELYHENDLQPFNVSYSSMPSIDIIAGPSYPESIPQVNHPYRPSL